MIIPFSIDVSSFGNPAIFHAYIFTLSPKNYLIVTPSECATPTTPNFNTQSPSIDVL